MTSLSDAMYGATISEDGRYRMHLVRAMRVPIPEARVVAFVLNNPSKADAAVNDATVRKLWAYTCAWGYTCLAVLNTNPFRSTDPAHGHIPEETTMECNDAWLQDTMRRAHAVVCGWGNDADPELARRAVSVMHSLGPLYALKINKNGTPAHPLYLPKNLEPQLWRPVKCLH